MNDALVSTRHAPYGNTLARDALDVALTYAAFDQTVSLLFLDDGVLQLLPQQAADTLEQKNIAKILQSLALYDIDKVYVDEAAMQLRGLDPQSCVLPVIPLDSAAIADLMHLHKIVLSF